MANFVAPYMRNFIAVINHRKFVPGSLEQIQATAFRQCVSPSLSALVPCIVSPLGVVHLTPD